MHAAASSHGFIPFNYLRWGKSALRSLPKITFFFWFEHDVSGLRAAFEESVLEIAKAAGSQGFLKA
jgi:hypothetical protein